MAGSATQPTGLYRHDLTTGETTLIKSSSTISIDPDYLIEPTTVTFPTSDDQVAHGFLYLPRNKDFTGPEDELPPLIVSSHGGPTSAANTSMELRFQFWTSRGFAVLDVNYGGSTGYGRAIPGRIAGHLGRRMTSMTASTGPSSWSSRASSTAIAWRSAAAAPADT